MGKDLFKVSNKQFPSKVKNYIQPESVEVIDNKEDYRKILYSLGFKKRDFKKINITRLRYKFD